MVGIKIMSAYVVVAIAIWMVLEPTLVASDIQFDIENASAATYSQLLTKVREEVKDKNIVYGGCKDIPVMAAPSAKYLYVDFTASQGRTIKIAVNLNKGFSLYVIAYLDIFNGNFRSHIFRDVPADVQRSLFPQAQGQANRLIMNYDSNYGSIESKAEVLRPKLGLGKQPIIIFFNKVYGKPVVDKNEAQFMLVVVQMLSEAARFAYIENMIVQKFELDINNCYKPDYKTIELEASWQKITVGIKNSRGDVISPSLALRYPDNNPWTVSSVKEIAKDMGLLKNEGATTTTAINRVYLENEGATTTAINRVYLENEGATTTAINRVYLAPFINKVQSYFNQFMTFFKASNGDDDYEAEL